MAILRVSKEYLLAQLFAGIQTPPMTLEYVTFDDDTLLLRIEGPGLPPGEVLVNAIVHTRAARVEFQKRPPWVPGTPLDFG